MNITRSQAAALIRSTKGRIFSALVVKRTTGEERKMVCRTEVRKGVTGRGLSYNPADKKLQIVFDLQKNAFRSIALDGLKELAVQGVRYKVIGE